MSQRFFDILTVGNENANEVKGAIAETKRALQDSDDWDYMKIVRLQRK